MNTQIRDFMLLDAAKKSNGGGVREAYFSQASVKRMEAAGYIARKKGDTTTANLWVITKAGREVLEWYETLMNRKDKIKEALAEEQRKSAEDLTTRILLGDTPTHGHRENFMRTHLGTPYSADTPPWED